MVWNSKIMFRVSLGILIVVFVLLVYFVFVDNGSGDSLPQKFLDAVGFKSGEDSNSDEMPLPSGSFNSGASGSGGGGSGSGGSSGGGSGGSGSGSGGAETFLRFCTFNAYHTITSEVPCRCGFVGVCYSEESVCDATFNNGEGSCS